MTSQSKAKHTRGPWTYDKIWSLIMGPNKEEIAAIHPGTNERAGRQNIGIAKANARLIAIAPDMKAILIEIIKDYEIFFQSQREGNPDAELDFKDRMQANVVDAEYALAKANGEEEYE